MEKDRIILTVSKEFIEFLQKHTPTGVVFSEYWGQLVETELYSWRKKMLDEIAENAEVQGWGGA